MQIARLLLPLSFLLFATEAVSQIPRWGLHSVGGFHSFMDSEGCCSFQQAELGLHGHTPLSLYGADVSLSVQYSAGIANLKTHSENATLISAGINLDFVWAVPVSLQFGLRPAWLDDPTWDNRIDLGGNFFFNSSIGVYYYHQHFAGGLRYNHISNAGTNNTNPGIDLLSLEFRYLFTPGSQQPGQRRDK